MKFKPGDVIIYLCNGGKGKILYIDGEYYMVKWYHQGPYAITRHDDWWLEGECRLDENSLIDRLLEKYS